MKVYKYNVILGGEGREGERYWYLLGMLQELLVPRS